MTQVKRNGAFLVMGFCLAILVLLPITRQRAWAQDSMGKGRIINLLISGGPDETVEMSFYLGKDPRLDGALREHPTEPCAAAVRLRVFNVIGSAGSDPIFERSIGLAPGGFDSFKFPLSSLNNGTSKHARLEIGLLKHQGACELLSSGLRILDKSGTTKAYNPTSMPLPFTRDMNHNPGLN